MYLLLYLLIIYGINFLHFLLYYYVSNYSYSIHNIIFTFLFSLFISWTITLSYKKWWKAINILIIIGIGFINIVNYLYYQVFNTFFNPFAQKAFIKEGSFAFFTKYIRDIPFSIYIINFAWITTLILLIVAYQPSYLRIEKLPFLHSIQGEKSYKRTKLAYLLFSIIIGIIMLISHYSYHLYLHNNPDSNWWNSKKQGQDYTIWGLFTYEKMFLPVHNFFIPPTTAAEIVNKDDLYTEILDTSVSTNTTPNKEIKKEEENIQNEKQNINEIIEDTVETKDIASPLKEKIVLPLISELTDFDKLNLLKNKFKDLNTKEDTNNQEILNNINIENPNIIMLQLESVASWGVNQEPSPMPFLKNLMAENYTVKNFFANSCETINAEFSSLCSFYPSSPGPISEYHKENDYYCLPELLKDKYNYETHVYHANNSDFWERGNLDPKWGFDNLHFSPEFQVRESDYQVLERLANDLSARNAPSFNYFVSFTSHSPHSPVYIDNYNLQNGDAPDIKLYNSPINQKILDNIEIKENTIRAYLSQLAAVDQSLQHFFDRLKKYNLLEKSIILIYNDHRYYNFFPNDNLENFYNYNELPFVMILPEKKKVELQNFASHIDLAPTILDLLDYKEELPQNFIGTSLFSDNHPNFAVNKCLDQIIYIDNNVLIKGNTKNSMYNIAELFNNDMNFYSYIPALTEYIEISDKILKENKLR